MEYIPPNPILEFKKDTLTVLRKQYNFETAADMDSAVDALDAWIKKQNHFVKKEFSRNYLERLIISNKGSVERTKMKLDKICTYRTLMPDFFGENLTKNKFDDINEISVAVLPKQTDDYYRIFCIKHNKKQIHTSEVLLNLYRFMVLVCEYKMAYDYSNGLVLFVDYSETNLIEIVTASELVAMRQATSIITEAFGMRVRGIHMLTPSKAVEALVTILKQMLSAKIGGRICVHKDMSTVYQHIPKDTFPSEYGGKEKSLLKLNDDLRNALNSKDFREHMEEINQAKTNETCRQTDKFNEQYMGTPGSFRSLTTD